MRYFIRQPCQICGEQIDEAHEEQHAPEHWNEQPWSASKIVWQAMIMGMDAQMMLVKGDKRILFEFVNHPDYSNSVMYLSYHYEDEADFQLIEKMFKDDCLSGLLYPEWFMYSIDEVNSTIEDFERKGYRFEPTED